MPMRQFAAGGVRICFQETYRRHDETGHAECALKALFIDHALLHRVQLSLGLASPSMVKTFRSRTVWVSTEHA